MRAFTLVILMLCLDIGWAIGTDSNLGIFDVGFQHNDTILLDYDNDSLGGIWNYDAPDVDEDQGYDPTEGWGLRKAVNAIGDFMKTAFWLPGLLTMFGVHASLVWFSTILVVAIYIMAAIQIFRGFSSGGAQ